MVTDGFVVLLRVCDIVEVVLEPFLDGHRGLANILDVTPCACDRVDEV